MKLKKKKFVRKQVKGLSLENNKKYFLKYFLLLFFNKKK